MEFWAVSRISARSRPKADRRGLFCDTVTCRPRPPEDVAAVEAHRRAEGIPGAESGAVAYSLTTRADCPGYVAMKRWTREDVEDAPAMIDDMNIADAVALGLVDE